MENWSARTKMVPGRKTIFNASGGSSGSIEKVDSAKTQAEIDAEMAKSDAIKDAYNKSESDKEQEIIKNYEMTDVNRDADANIKRFIILSIGIPALILAGVLLYKETKK